MTILNTVIHLIIACRYNCMNYSSLYKIIDAFLSYDVASRSDIKPCDEIFWFFGFVALRPKSTAMVIAGRSVHLTTLFPGQA